MAATITSTTLPSYPCPSCPYYRWPSPLVVSSAMVMFLALTPSAAPAEDNSVWQDILKGAPPIQYSTLSGPSFLNNTEAGSVKVVAGTTAMLPCRIRNLHNYTVSWLRGQDIRLLTTSSVTYTSDGRFVAVNPSGGEQWLLKIHYVRKGDAGSYLCQVSTTPPITLTVNLTVHEAVASIIPPRREVYVQSGSRLEVACQVQGCPPPSLLAWTRGGQPVTTPEPSTFDSVDGNVTMSVSRLQLARPHATAADSGTYSCSSTCTVPINVTVHVLQGEELAAMQHLNASCRQALPSGPLCSLLATTTLLLLLTRCWTEGLLQPYHHHHLWIPPPGVVKTASIFSLVASEVVRLWEGASFLLWGPRGLR